MKRMLCLLLCCCSLAYGQENRFVGNTETAKNLNISMVFVKGGVFMMGCTDSQEQICDHTEKPAHRVKVSNFYIGKYEVTQAQWMAIMGSNPSHFKGDNLPVENVSWEDVQEFILKLNAVTGKQYRLPTEAEWEYAARGGNKKIPHFLYNDFSTVSMIAWCSINSEETTHPVGKKRPNDYVIYDMSGNVSEWCSDWYDSYGSRAQTNPQGPSSGVCRVVRGGSWDGLLWDMYITRRFNFAPDYRSNTLGFRLACSSK